MALLEILGVIDERQLWRSDGCCSMVDWISFRFGVTRKTAHEWIDGNPQSTVQFVKPNGDVLTSEVPKVSDAVKKRLLDPVLPDG